MASCYPNASIVSALVAAGADPNTQDSGGRTPLFYATAGKHRECMRILLDYKANVNDESLHAAARDFDHETVQLLLLREADPDHRGTTHCAGRTALGELCSQGEATRDPAQAQRTMQLLSEASKESEVLVLGKSILMLALDNKRSALVMVRTLLTSCPDIQKDINEDVNIYAKGSLRFSPTAYVRHFLCAQSKTRRNLKFSERCCKLSECQSSKLEALLRVYGCKDRYWDDEAGIEQPAGYSEPPEGITLAIRKATLIREEQEREATRRAEQARLLREAEEEERARQARHQRALDQAAAAEVRREQERAQAVAETQAARTRATQQAAYDEIVAMKSVAAAEEHTRAVEAANQAKRQALEYQLERRRSLEEFQEIQRRATVTHKTERLALQSKADIATKQEKQEADVKTKILLEEKKVMGERRKLAGDVATMFRDAGNAGFSPGQVSQIQGRILGEVDDDARLIGYR